MKRLMLIAFLSSFAFVAQAEDAPPPTAAADEVVEISGDSLKDEATAKSDRYCLRETGSRIRRSDARACNGLAGRVYTRDDLERTGGITTAEALQTLDPSIRVGH